MINLLTRVSLSSISPLMGLSQMLCSDNCDSGFGGIGFWGGRCIIKGSYGLQSGKRLPLKHGGLSLDPLKPWEKPGIKAGACNPSMWRAESGGSEELSASLPLQIHELQSQFVPQKIKLASRQWCLPVAFHASAPTCTQAHTHQQVHTSHSNKTTHQDHTYTQRFTPQTLTPTHHIHTLYTHTLIHMHTNSTHIHDILSHVPTPYTLIDAYTHIHFTNTYTHHIYQLYTCIHTKMRLSYYISI